MPTAAYHIDMSPKSVISHLHYMFTGHFKKDSGLVPAIFVAIKICILSQNMIFQPKTSSFGSKA